MDCGEAEELLTGFSLGEEPGRKDLFLLQGHMRNCLRCQGHARRLKTLGSPSLEVEGDTSAPLIHAVHKIRREEVFRKKLLRFLVLFLLSIGVLGVLDLRPSVSERLLVRVLETKRVKITEGLGAEATSRMEAAPYEWLLPAFRQGGMLLGVLRLRLFDQPVFFVVYGDFTSFEGYFLLPQNGFPGATKESPPLFYFYPPWQSRGGTKI